MKYVIDANNLAGKLDLLKEKDFDALLIKRIKRFFGNNTCPVFLVFDSADPMGDKYKDDNIEVIYTPKDDYYNSADDRILELIRSREDREELVAVTDDRGLADKIEEQDNQVIIKKASDISRKIKEQEKTPGKADKDKLTEQEIKDINQELLNKFKGN